MIIDFKKMDEKIIPSFKNGEGAFNVKMYTDDLNKILYGTLKTNSSIGYHKHEGNSEIIYILSGKAKCLYDDEVLYLEAGDCHYCKNGHSHSLINENEEDLVFFAIVPEQ